MRRTQVVAVVDSDAATPQEVARLLAEGADVVQVVEAAAPGAAFETGGGLAAGDGGPVRGAHREPAAALATDDLAAMVVAAVLGCTEIRTRNVRAARRVVDVIAAIENAP